MEKDRTKFLSAKLITAIQREDVDGVRKWLNEGASPNPPPQCFLARFFWGPNDSPLAESLRTGSVAIMRILLKQIYFENRSRFGNDYA